MHSWYNDLHPDDPAMLATYEAVGRALCEWSKLEGNLCDLFHELSGMTDPTKSHEVFFSSNGSVQRLKLLKSLLEISGDGFRSVEFYRRVVQTSVELTEVRNQIAHGFFVAYSGENVVDIASQRHIQRGTKKFLSIQEIVRFSEYLFKLNRLLWYSFEFMLIEGQNEHLTPECQLADLGKF